MRLVVLFVVGGEPRERSGDDGRAQEILDDFAIRGEVVEDGADRFGSGAGIGAWRRRLGRYSLIAASRAVALLFGDVRDHGSASCGRRRSTIHTGDTSHRIVVVQKQVQRAERRERARLWQAKQLFNEVHGGGELRLSGAAGHPVTQSRAR